MNTHRLFAKWAAVPATWVLIAAAVAFAQGLTSQSRPTRPSNSAPRANAGPDKTSAMTAAVNLDGTGSTDVDGDALTFKWRVRSAPSGSRANLSNPSAARPTFTVDEPGAYVLELVVNDGAASSPPDIMIVRTDNSAPVANAGANRRASVTDTVTLDGSGSTDVDGDPLTYSWSLMATPAGSGVVLTNPDGVLSSFTVDVPGTFVVQLIVHDGTTVSEPATIVVTTENIEPIAEAGPPLSARDHQVVLLDGTSSSDADRDILTYSWALTVRPTGSAATLIGASSAGPSFMPDLPGHYVAQLIVSDLAAYSVPDTVTVTVGADSPPVANAGPDQIDVPMNVAVTLDGSASRDSDGDPLGYAWSFTTRPAGSAAALIGTDTALPTFTPDLPGIYVAQLRVSDGDEGSEPDTALVRVNGATESDVTTTAIPIASLVGTWSGGTGQVPSQLYKMWVDTAGVIGIQTTALGSGFAPCNIVLIDLNMSSPAAITNDSFTANFSHANGTGVVAGTFSSDLAASGTINVTFSGITGCAPISTTWTATKVDSGPIPVLSVSATDPNASEVGSDDGTFTITRTGSTAEAVSVQYNRGGSATNAIDYTNLPGGVMIPAGAASVPVTVDPIADAEVEGSQTVILTLVDRPAYKITAPTSATVTIADQPIPLLTITASDRDAYEAGPDQGAFTFTRTGSTAGSLTVSYSISGTATHVTDYGQIFSPVTIPAGSASVVRAVSPVSDGIVESPETVILTLTDGANYDLGMPSTATVTISDTAPSPTVTVAATDPNADESGTNSGTFTFTRTGSTASSLTVNFTTSGTADPGVDYTALGTSVVISSGQASATKSVAPLPDGMTESETVIVTLAAGSYTIGAPSTATVTIADAPSGQPNLRVTQLTGPATAGAGLPYAAKDTTSNAGAASAAESATKFFLSINNTWDAGDTPLVPVAGRSIPVLAVSGTSTGTTMVTIPAGTPISRRFLIAYADGNNSVSESNEADNIKVKTIYVGPDLTVSKLVAPLSAARGAMISVNETTKNLGGTATTATTTTQLYLSLDKKKGAGDIPLGTGRSIGPLGAGSSSAVTTTVTIPAGITPGPYFILGSADDGGAQVESRETNNVRAAAITIN